MSESLETNLTFEQSLAELDRVVRDLEDGQLGLEEALARYETGVGLLKRCYTQLREAEQRITLLAGVDTDGKPVTRPFEHTATADAAPVGPPGVKARTALKKKGPPEIPF